MARITLGMSEYRRAIEFLEEALHLHRVAYGDEAEETLIAQHSLAEAYEEDGQFDKAILYYEQTLEFANTSAGRSSRRYTREYGRVGTDV